jgi:hypothetical protein
MAQRSTIDDLRPGDILGFSGCSWLSAGINLCTLGLPLVGISHVAIIASVPGDGPLLWESTALTHRPCFFQGRRIDGVQAHKIAPRLRDECRYTKVWHYPLSVELDERDSHRLTCYLYSMLGRSYDYLGALRARETPASWIEHWLCPENLQSVFCSELAAAALKRVGRLTCNASNMNPNRLCRTLVRCGITRQPIRLQ